MCCIDDGERCQVSEFWHRKARKPHKCEECGRTILTGERYQYGKTLFDGSWDEHFVCAHCEVGTQWLSDNCGGYLFSQAHEELEEHIDEYPLLGLTIFLVVEGMRRKWLALDGGLLPIPEAPINIEAVI